jgi:hypothetical protein
VTFGSPQIHTSNQSLITRMAHGNPGDPLFLTGVTTNETALQSRSETAFPRHATMQRPRRGNRGLTGEMNSIDITTTTVAVSPTAGVVEIYTADEFRRWRSRAEINDRILYFVGNLALERSRNATLHALADAVLRSCEMDGLTHPTQRRVDAETCEYWASAGNFEPPLAKPRLRRQR